MNGCVQHTTLQVIRLTESGEERAAVICSQDKANNDLGAVLAI